MRAIYGMGYGEVDSLPGCSQVAVSHSAFIPEHSRGQGYGTSAHRERLKHMIELGYDYGICTVNTSNAAQIHILESNGWKKLDAFKSSKTGHLVAIYGKPLDKP